MKIIIADNAYDNGAMFDDHAKVEIGKEYEVISVVMQYAGEKYSSNIYRISYIILSDDYKLVTARDTECHISDGTVDSDFEYVYCGSLESYVLKPKILPCSFIYDRFMHNDLLEYSDEFCERFKHLLPDYIYAQCFKERYQDPNIKIEAEPIGENWVLCPECHEVFEVSPDQGVVKCQNIACRELLNNPYAPKMPKEHKKE